MQEVPSVKFASITSFPPIVLQVDPNDKSVVPKVTQHQVDWIGYRSTKKKKKKKERKIATRRKEGETERKERQRNREAENIEGERDQEIKTCSLQSENEKMS